LSVYVDSSALLKRYIAEPDSEFGQRLIAEAGSVVTARVTVVEVRRALSTVASAAERAMARENFSSDIAAIALIEVDRQLCESAAVIAETTGVRSLDAIHLAAARRAGCATFITFDVRQGRVAEQMGLHLLGVPES